MVLDLILYRDFDNYLIELAILRLVKYEPQGLEGNGGVKEH